MKCLSRKNQTNIIEALNSTSRYLDDLLNIDNIDFDQMVDRIYPTELGQYLLWPNGGSHIPYRTPIK